VTGEDNVVHLDKYRKQKYILKMYVGGYYVHPELGVHLHCIGMTSPMHTKNDEVHFIIEDNFGSLATFQIDDPPVGFVESNIAEFAQAWFNGTDPNKPVAS
jgi:hypothetical protein